MKRLIKFILTIIAIFILITMFSLELRGYIEKKVRKDYNDYIKQTEWVKAAREARQMVYPDSISIKGNATITLNHANL